MHRSIFFHLGLIGVLALVCVQCTPASATTLPTPVLAVTHAATATAVSASPTPLPLATATAGPQASPVETSTPLPTITTAPTTAQATPSTSLYNWLQFNGNAQHDGNNTRETTLTASNVSSLARLFQVTLPSIADGAPVYLSNVSTPKGQRGLLFLTTKAGHILALDALTGETIWSHQYPAGTCRINNVGGPCFTASSPAVDPNLQYVYSYGLDGYVHKYQASDGTEIKTGGWPELATLKPYNEKVSPALSVATLSGGTSYLYVSNGGNLGDRGDYQGHITAINLADGSQRVFNTLCSDQAVHFVEQPGTPDCPEVQSAVWARPGVVFDPATGKIYFSTGNGTFNPANHDWGDSVLALNPDGSGANGNPLDSYTPANFQQLDQADIDLGSTSPVILPGVPGSKLPHLALQGGKDQLLRLINLDNLSGQGKPGFTGGEVGQIVPVPQGGLVFSTPAAWTNPADGSVWAFVTTANGISGIRVSADSAGNPAINPVWTDGTGGSSPIVANGVLFYASSGKVLALNPTTGKVLWASSAIGNIHWESPVVANGLLYITDESGQLTAFSLNGHLPNAASRIYLPAVLS